MENNNKMKQVRNNIFETNSSSTHAIVISKLHGVDDIQISENNTPYSLIEDCNIIDYLYSSKEKENTVFLQNIIPLLGNSDFYDLQNFEHEGDSYIEEYVTSFHKVCFFWTLFNQLKLKGERLENFLHVINDITYDCVRNEFLRRFPQLHIYLACWCTDEYLEILKSKFKLVKQDLFWTSKTFPYLKFASLQDYISIIKKLYKDTTTFYIIEESIVEYIEYVNKKYDNRISKTHYDVFQKWLQCKKFEAIHDEKNDTDTYEWGIFAEHHPVESLNFWGLNQFDECLNDRTILKKVLFSREVIIKGVRIG